MESKENNEIASIELQNKIYLYAVIENCIIYIIVFVGVAIYKQGLLLLLLLFCNSLKKKK